MVYGYGFFTRELPDSVKALRISPREACATESNPEYLKLLEQEAPVFANLLLITHCSLVKYVISPS